MKNIEVFGRLTGANGRILEEIYDKNQTAREWTHGITSLSADDILCVLQKCRNVEAP